MEIWYAFKVNDSMNNGVRMSKLTPTWTMFQRLDTDEKISPRPVIKNVGYGLYKFSYDASCNGEAVCQVDCGELLVNHDDRYPAFILTKEPDSILRTSWKVTTS